MLCKDTSQLPYLEQFLGRVKVHPSFQGLAAYALTLQSLKVEVPLGIGIEGRNLGQRNHGKNTAFGLDHGAQASGVLLNPEIPLHPLGHCSRHLAATDSTIR